MPKLKLWFAAASLLLLLAIAISFVVAVRSAGRAVFWSNQTGEPLRPEQFKLLLFSADEQIALAELASTTLPSRAVLTTLSEAGQEQVEVFLDANSAVYVDRHSLTPKPPYNGHTQAVEGLNKAIESWGDETDWRRVSFHTASVDNRSTEVTLRVHAKRGYVMEYQYHVSAGDQITPMLIHRIR